MVRVKRCAEGRLERNRVLDQRRERRFKEDVRGFWRGEKSSAGGEGEI